MPISDIPILSMLRTRMQWHQERQRVLAENVANADTPDYRARDLAPPNFERALQTSLSLATTNSPRTIRTTRCARAAPRSVTKTK
jgi:flagellar basal-body rod protein FlgB